MKYSGTDFKMTSQANHLAKLINLLSECQRQSHHMQRLYKRRRINYDSRYRSNWDSFGYGVYNAIPVLLRRHPSSSPSNKPPKPPEHTTPEGEKLIDECESYWQELDD